MEGGGVREVLLRAGEDGGQFLYLISWGQLGRGFFLLDICVHGCMYLGSRNVYTSFHHLSITHYIASGARNASLALKGTYRNGRGTVGSTPSL